ncbi:hypothetical protein D3C81_2150480 [compost metagenome]
MEQNIEVGQKYNRFFIQGNPAEVRVISCKISAIIDDLSLLPMNILYRGHKAIVGIEFDEDTENVFELPVIEGFYMNKNGDKVILFYEVL